MKTIKLLLVCMIACWAVAFSIAIDRPLRERIEAREEYFRDKERPITEEDLEEYFAYEQDNFLKRLGSEFLLSMEENEILLKVRLLVVENGKEMTLMCQGKFKEGERNLLLASSNCNGLCLAVDGVVNRANNDFVFKGDVTLAEEARKRMTRCAPELVLQNNIGITTCTETRRIGARRIMQPDGTTKVISEVVGMKEVQFLATWK